MHRKKIVIGALVVLLFLGVLGIVGYFAALKVAAGKFEGVMASVQRSLPPGTRLTYGALSIRPFSLAAAVDNVQLSDPAKGLDVRIGTVLAGKPTFDLGSLKRLDLGLRDLRLTRSGEVELGALSVDVESLDLKEVMALAKGWKDLKDRGVSLSDPSFFAGLTLGTVRVDGVTARFPEKEVRVSVRRVSLDQMTAGRFGTLSVEGIDVGSGQRSGTIGAFSLTGLDLGRASAWYRRTGGNLFPQARLDVDFFGLEGLSLKNVDIKTDDKTLAFQEVALKDLDSRNNFPIRMTVRIEGLKAPVAFLPGEVMTPDLADLIQRTNLAASTLSFEWQHALDDGAKRLTIGPMMADLGPLGRITGHLDLTNVNRASLSALKDDSRQQERLINEVRIRGGMVDIQAGPGTSALIDFLTAQAKTTRSALIERISSGDIAASSVLLLGDRTGLQITDALSAFLRRPGTFRFSADAGTGAMSLTTLGMTISSSPERTAQAYNIKAEYDVPAK